MAGLVPAIHVFTSFGEKKDVDARDKPGHDERKTTNNTERKPHGV
jgi:hypothetical protein